MADYSITGDTRLDTSGFTKGVSSMTVAAGTLIADLVKTAGSKLAGLAQSSISVGMNFDASMSQVAATMGKSVEEIDNLTKAAKEMGSTTKFTATQAADALNYLALAGYDADKAAEVLPSVLNLAAAGGMDLAYASDLVTDAMASLNLEASKQNVDEFGNKLAMAASKANANVAQLGEAILTVGGTAANLKGGTTELTTALGLLANVGIKGAEGGTHLRNIILSLQSPTDDAAGTMEKLGLSVYDAQGNMRGLDEILGDLNRSMAGMTQGQKDSIINQLFNKTDLAAVNGLLAAQGEQWATLAAQIDAADGAMGQMAETQQDNLQGVMTSLGSAFEGLQIAIYDDLEPTLTEAGNWGIQCVRQLSTALSENGPEAMLQAAGELLANLASGIAAQLPGLTTTGVEIIAKLAEGLVAATPQIMSSAAEVVSALIQALGTALPQLVSTGLAMISQLGAGLKEGLPEFLAQALPVVADFASGLRENVDQIVDAGIEFILNLAQGLMDGLPTLIEQLPGIVSDIAGIINDNAPKILLAGVYLIETLGKGLLQAIPALIQNIPQICQAIFDVFTAFRWLDIGKYIVDGLWNGITAGWNALISKVKDLVNLLPKAAKIALGIHSPSKVFDEIGVQVCNGLAQGLDRGKAKVKNAAKTVIASVTDTATTLTDGVTRTVETTTEKMASGLIQQKQTITETSRQMVNGVLKDVKTITEVAADGTKTVKQTMETVREVEKTVTATREAVVDGIQTSTQTVTETLTDGTEQQKQVITETYDDVVDGALVTVQRVRTIAADGTEQVTEQIRKSAADSLDGLWKELQTRADTGLLGTFDDLFTAVQKQDWAGIGKWAAAAIYGGLTANQKQQLETYALGLVDQLNAVLQRYQTDLAAKAWDIGTQICEGLTHGFADVWQQTTQLGATLTNIFQGLKEPLSTAALAISQGLSGGLLSSLPEIYTGVAGMVGTVGAAFEGLLTAISAALDATVFGIPMGVVVAAAAVALGAAIAGICASLGSSSGGSSSASSASGGSKKTIASTTDITSSMSEDGTKTVVKTVTETLQDEAGELTQKITKTVTETGTKLVDGVQRSCETVTTYVDGIVQRVDTTLKDLEQAAASTDTSTPETPPDEPVTPDPAEGTGSLEDAITANTKALEQSNAALAEMVRQANSLVLSDNMRLGSTVAASGTAQVAAAANSYRREGDTNITQNIYSKAQTAADLARETRWEADRAKAQKR